MKNASLLIRDNNLAGSKERFSQSVAFVQRIAYDGVINDPYVLEALRLLGVIGQVQVELCKLRERRVGLSSSSRKVRGIAPSMFECDFDVAPCAADSLDLVALHHLIQDERTNVSSECYGWQPLPKRGNSAFAPEHAFVEDGKFAGNSQEELAGVQIYTGAKCRLARYTLL